LQEAPNSKKKAANLENTADKKVGQTTEDNTAKPKKNRRNKDGKTQQEPPVSGKDV
jgi:hypothetical protein